MCFVKCQNILVNVLVHLLEPPNFRLRCPSFLLSNLCFIIKVTTICGAGRDTRNLCHKFSSQGLCFQESGFQGNMSQVPGAYFQSPVCQGTVFQVPRVPGSRVPGSRVSGSQSPGSQSPGHQVLILDYAARNLRLTKEIFFISSNLWVLAVAKNG